MQEIDLFEAIYTQRQTTHYKNDPVSMELIHKVIEAATKAPSGANYQMWDFIVITDPDLITRISQVTREALIAAGLDGPQPGEAPVYKNARYLRRHMSEVPAMILICADHSRGYQPYTPGEPIVRGKYDSSIWLAAQNLFLAARAYGLGTRITLGHLFAEQQVREMLGIPDHVEPACLTPIGYPRSGFGPTNRRPAAEVTHYNGWGAAG